MEVHNVHLGRFVLRVLLTAVRRWKVKKKTTPREDGTPPPHRDIQCM